MKLQINSHSRIPLFVSKQVEEKKIIMSSQHGIVTVVTYI